MTLVDMHHGLESRNGMFSLLFSLVSVNMSMSSSRVHYGALLLAGAHVICHDVILFVSHVTGLAAICKFNSSLV